MGKEWEGVEWGGGHLVGLSWGGSLWGMFWELTGEGKIWGGSLWGCLKGE